MPIEMPTQTQLPRDSPFEPAIDFTINTQWSCTNQYGTQQSRIRLVVDGATAFKRQESPYQN